MKTFGFTYGNELFTQSRVRAFESLKPYVDECMLFTEKDLEPYKSTYGDVLKHSRGGGYWLYKSIFLNKIFETMNEGDAVIYIDAGIEAKKDFRILFDIAKKNNGFCLFKHPHLNYKWTKRDCFILMECDNSHYHNEYQCDASTQVYIKNMETTNFITMLLKYGSDERIIGDKPNVMGHNNISGFIDHRHDQSILTLLCLKHNINRFKQASQYYLDWQDDSILNPYETEVSKTYDNIFFHHRSKG